MKSWKVLILILSAFVSSCKDSPSSFGEEFIPPDDKYNFQQAENTSQRDSTFFNEEYSAVIAASQELIIGKVGDFKSTALIKFPLSAPDSIKSMLNEGEIFIKSTWVEMVPTHYYGNKNDNFDFTVHKILNQTDFSKINSSTFPNVVYDPVDISYSRNYSDTLTVFHINPDIVKDWIKVQYDSLNTPKNYGVMLIPSASTNKAVEYYSHENMLSTGARIFFEFEKPNAYVDTLSAFATIDTYYAENPMPNDLDKYIYLIGGVTIKNKIEFVLPQLPKNAVMNKATLELYQDSTKSIKGIPTDTTFLEYGVIVNVLRITQANSLIVDTSSVAFVIQQASPNRVQYIGDLSAITQKWINENNNFGLILSVSGEESDASKLVFYGSNYPNLTLRPRLKITYTLRNIE